MSATVPPPLGPLALSRSVLDRAAHRRTDARWLARAWADRSTRVLLVSGAHAHVEPGDASALRLVPPPAAPEGDRYFLGVDATGTAYFAVASPEFASGAVSLRELGPLLGDRDAGLGVAASALANWHATHRHCPRCGAATVVESGGWTRRCPVDESEHYPRTDPAVIMTVIDDADRVLLGHQPSWPANRYSTLAGFVEAGESLEAAVRREVLEEVGVVVGDVEYLGNQPWPFPSSLMLGFCGQASTTELVLDESEITAAQWYTRAEMRAAIDAGELLLPGAVSIARRLIEHWYGGSLPG